MKPLPAQNLRDNLRLLLKETGITTTGLAAKSGISKRMIDYILSGERGASIDVAESLAKAFGLNGWQLIKPNLQYDLHKSGRLEELEKKFLACEQETQDYVLSVMKREARN